MTKKPRRANDLLRQAREAKGWTQRHLAKAVGVGESTVRSWEYGDRSPSLAVRLRLCQALEKTPQELGLPPGKTRKQEQPLLQAGTAHISSMNVNRQRMLNRVHTYWIKEVFDRSLYNELLIILGLKEQPNAVANPWRLVTSEADQPFPLLPAGTPITEVYDDAHGELLILGEPGAGKTTLLLELTRDLLKRAAQNEQHPMPVVFHLSSWATKRAALADWLVEELMSKYIVPRHIAQQWVEVDHILPLLDGLDEVDEAYRSACVIAMNQYRQNHGLASMVVCCRYQDYFAQTERMMLEKAILLQPLNIQQMLDYLARAGKPLESLRHVLQTDTALQEMVTTPLMLSIMALTYQGNEVTPAIQGTLEERRRHIFHLYIERMLARRGQKRTYSPEQTQCWLGWLARLMQEQNQTEFYVERLHPKVLPAKQQQRHYTSMVWMINGISNMILLMLFGWFRGGKTVADDGLGTGLLGQLGAPPGDAILQWMAPGVGGGLGGGATVGLIMVLIAIFSGRLIKTASYDTGGWTWPSIAGGLMRGLRQGLRIGLAVCVPGVLLFSILYGPPTGLSYGITFGLYGGLITGLLAITADESTKEVDISRSLLAHIADAVVIGMCAGAGFYLTNGLIVKSVQAIPFAMMVSIFGGAFFLLDERRHHSEGRGLGTWMKPIETIDWSWSNLKHHLRVHLRRGSLLGLIVCLWVSLTFGITSSFFHGWVYGWTYGVMYGLMSGAVTGATAILIMVLNSGWTSDLLEEDHLRKPNEGIHRSLRHALFASLLLGAIVGIFSGVASGLAFGLIGGLSGWVTLACGFGIVCSIDAIYIFWIVYGGGAWMAHLILRLQLWRQGAMPLAIVPFLEYAVEHVLLRKVGGGYIFVHRLLLEHFAAIPPSKKCRVIQKR